ncbi:hypothetical protein BC834DRAFT_343571 [Gloeopeniophorella convolvens]|nr:hypothetical protein BC834DRAFT_343571 [Gloeopeniophorella convolvens]
MPAFPSPASSSSSLPLDSWHAAPARLISSLKRPFSKPRLDPPPMPSDRPRAPHSAAPPTYEQIAMGLHLSRTPHLPSHLAHLYPPALQRSASSPASPPQRPHTHRRAPSLPPPPARSALKKPRAEGAGSSATPDTASASTATSSAAPATPAGSTTSARSRLFSRLRGASGKERGRSATPPPPLVVEPERKAVRFGGLDERDES